MGAGAAADVQQPSAVAERGELGHAGAEPRREVVQRAQERERLLRIVAQALAPGRDPRVAVGDRLREAGPRAVEEPLLAGDLGDRVVRRRVQGRTDPLSAKPSAVRSASPSATSADSNRAVASAWVPSSPRRRRRSRGRRDGVTTPVSTAVPTIAARWYSVSM